MRGEYTPSRWIPTAGSPSSVSLVERTPRMETIGVDWPLIVEISMFGTRFARSLTLFTPLRIRVSWSNMAD